MKASTVAITRSPKDWGSERVELNRLRFTLPAASGRTLPADVIALADRKRVLKQIAAAGDLVPALRRKHWQRPDGLAKTRFSLSEIAFDSPHRFAEVAFGADCGCKGGEGGTALFERTSSGWKRVALASLWKG